jgi:hypothetical protein
MNTSQPFCWNIAIHVSLGLTKTTLNHYYTKTDDSELYQIAMGMCLQHTMFLFTEYP